MHVYGDICGGKVWVDQNWGIVRHASVDQCIQHQDSGQEQIKVSKECKHFKRLLLYMYIM